MNSVPVLIGKDPDFLYALRLVERVAPTDVSLLMTGESGTGKTKAAKHTHLLSPRRNNPFVRIDPAQSPDTLIQSENFGHIKGAFTGDERPTRGKFEAADKGTLYIDKYKSSQRI